jgi:hypothetical protein
LVVGCVIVTVDADTVVAVTVGAVTVVAVTVVKVPALAVVAPMTTLFIEPVGLALIVTI